MNDEREAKAIREELAYIGRYCDGISPKLARYQELQKKKEVLRERLKQLKLSAPGTDPQPMQPAPKGVKFQKAKHKDWEPFAGEDKGRAHQVYEQTKRTY